MAKRFKLPKLNRSEKIATLGTVVSLGTAIYVLSQSDSSGNRSANVDGGGTINKDELVNLIKSDTQLQALLRGRDGVNGSTGLTGETGANGVSGENGLSGDQIQNYGGSIVKNGAFELGNLEGWEGLTNQQLIIDTDGNKLVLVGDTVISNDQEILIDGRSIYKTTAKIYVIGAGGVVGLLMKSDNYIIGSDSYCFEGSHTKVSYFSGIGVNKFPSIFTKAKVVITSNANVTSATISNLVVSKVEIGEPVPFNLPYLPVGQMVFDPTDGAVGRYDGTTIHWFSMV